MKHKIMKHKTMNHKTMKHKTMNHKTGNYERTDCESADCEKTGFERTNGERRNQERRNRERKTNEKIKHKETSCQIANSGIMKYRVLRFFAVLILSSLIPVALFSAAQSSGAEKVISVRPKKYLASPYSSFSMTYGDTCVIPCLTQIAQNRLHETTVADPMILAINAEGTILTAVSAGSTKVTVLLHSPDETYEYSVSVGKACLSVSAEGETHWEGDTSSFSHSMQVTGWKMHDVPDDFVLYRPPSIDRALTETQQAGSYPMVCDFSEAHLPSDGSGQSNYYWSEQVKGTYVISGIFRKSSDTPAGGQDTAAILQGSGGTGSQEEEEDSTRILGDTKTVHAGIDQNLSGTEGTGAAANEESYGSERTAASAKESQDSTVTDGSTERSTALKSENTSDQSLADTENMVQDAAAPAVFLYGVGDGSSNAKIISADVRMEASRIDDVRSYAVLTGEKAGTVEGNMTVSKEEGVICVRYDNLPMDDHYTLVVHAFDLSGNRTDKEYRFTQNCRGTEFTYRKLNRQEVQDEGFSPSVKLENLDPVKIVSVTINGSEVPYELSGGILTVNSEETVKGKNRLIITSVDAAGNLSAMAPWEFFCGELSNKEDCVIISNTSEAKTDVTDKRDFEMNKRKDKRIFAMLIIVGVLILACIGILIGMKLGNAKRQAVSQASLDSKAAESRVLADSRDALAESAKALENSAADASEAALEAAEQQKTSELLAEQTKAAKEEDAEKLKGIITAGVPNVSAYADAKKNAPTVSAQTVSSDTSSKAAGTNGHTVCIDAGHQTHTSDSQFEANGPGSDTTKLAVSSGTNGVATGMEEYELNLEVALQLQTELQNRGYTVVMTRMTNDVQLTNIDRAKIANESSNIMVRIHANSADDSSVSGALTYAPSSDNPYLSTDLINQSTALATDVLNAFCNATGAKNRGVLDSNEMTGINWSTIPVTYVEMGFMSNPDEDEMMASAAYQAKMVQGIANGIDAYFAAG